MRRARRVGDGLPCTPAAEEMGIVDPQPGGALRSRPRGASCFVGTE